MHPSCLLMIQHAIEVMPRTIVSIHDILPMMSAFAASKVEILQAYQRIGLDDGHQLCKVCFQVVDLFSPLLHPEFLKARATGKQ